MNRKTNTRMKGTERKKKVIRWEKNEDGWKT